MVSFITLIFTGSALTSLGHSLRSPVAALGMYAQENQDAVEASRQAFDHRHEPPE